MGYSQGKILIKDSQTKYTDNDIKPLIFPENFSIISKSKINNIDCKIIEFPNNNEKQIDCEISLNKINFEEPYDMNTIFESVIQVFENMGMDQPNIIYINIENSRINLFFKLKYIDEIIIITNKFIQLIKNFNKLLKFSNDFDYKVHKKPEIQSSYSPLNNGNTNIIIFDKKPSAPASKKRCLTFDGSRKQEGIKVKNQDIVYDVAKTSEKLGNKIDKENESKFLIIENFEDDNKNLENIVSLDKELSENFLNSKNVEYFVEKEDYKSTDDKNERINIEKIKKLQENTLNIQDIIQIQDNNILGNNKKNILLEKENKSEKLEKVPNNSNNHFEIHHDLNLQNHSDFIKNKDYKNNNSSYINNFQLSEKNNLDDIITNIVSPTNLHQENNRLENFENDLNLHIENPEKSEFNNSNLYKADINYNQNQELKFSEDEKNFEKSIKNNLKEKNIQESTEFNFDTKDIIKPQPNEEVVKLLKELKPFNENISNPNNFTEYFKDEINQISENIKTDNTQKNNNNFENITCSNTKVLDLINEYNKDVKFNQNFVEKNLNSTNIITEEEPKITKFRNGNNYHKLNYNSKYFNNKLLEEKIVRRNQMLQAQINSKKFNKDNINNNFNLRKDPIEVKNPNNIVAKNLPLPLPIADNLGLNLQRTRNYYINNILNYNPNNLNNNTNTPTVEQNYFKNIPNNLNFENFVKNNPNIKNMHTMYKNQTNPNNNQGFVNNLNIINPYNNKSQNLSIPNNSNKNNPFGLKDYNLLNNFQNINELPKNSIHNSISCNQQIPFIGNTIDKPKLISNINNNLNLNNTEINKKLKDQKNIFFEEKILYLENKIKIISLKEDILEGFYFKKNDYQSDEEFSSFYLLGNLRDINEGELNDFFLLFHKINLKQKIKNPNESENISRLIFYNDQKMSDFLKNQKNNQQIKIIILEREFLMIKINSSILKVHPEELYLDLQIKLNFSTSNFSEDNFLNYIQGITYEIFEISFMEKGRCVITYFNSEHVKESLRILSEKPFHQIKTGTYKINISPQIIYEPFPIYGNKINLLYSENIISIPPRPPVGYKDTLLRFTPSLRKLISNKSQWENYKIEKGDLNQITIEEFYDEIIKLDIEQIKKVYPERNFEEINYNKNNLERNIKFDLNDDIKIGKNKKENPRNSKKDKNKNKNDRHLISESSLTPSEDYSNCSSPDDSESDFKIRRRKRNKNKSSLNKILKIKNKNDLLKNNIFDDIIENNLKNEEKFEAKNFLNKKINKVEENLDLSLNLIGKRRKKNKDRDYINANLQEEKNEVKNRDYLKKKIITDQLSDNLENENKETSKKPKNLNFVVVRKTL